MLHVGFLKESGSLPSVDRLSLQHLVCRCSVSHRPRPGQVSLLENPGNSDLEKPQRRGRKQRAVLKCHNSDCIFWSWMKRFQVGWPSFISFGPIPSTKIPAFGPRHCLLLVHTRGNIGRIMRPGRRNRIGVRNCSCTCWFQAFEACVWLSVLACSKGKAQLPRIW